MRYALVTVVPVLFALLIPVERFLHTAAAPRAAPAAAPAAAEADLALANPNIDMPGFLVAAQRAARHRESRRVSEADFIRMSREPNTIILDARSREKYDLLHIAGAVNLSFPDITIESLARTIPDKSTRVLIYCNNNFRNEERAFPAKLSAASLNLSTYVTLFNYGYENVYELAPLIDPKESKLTFASNQPPAPPAEAGW